MYFMVIVYFDDSVTVLYQGDLFSCGYLLRVFTDFGIY
jgi:hypothetical protein